MAITPLWTYQLRKIDAGYRYLTLEERRVCRTPQVGALGQLAWEIILRLHYNHLSRREIEALLFPAGDTVTGCAIAELRDRKFVRGSPERYCLSAAGQKFIATITAPSRIAQTRMKRPCSRKAGALRVVGGTEIKTKISS